MIDWPFVSRRERVRRQAADWVARLHGPHSDDDRAAFEKWCRTDPAHVAAYNRLSVLFKAAGQIRPQASAPLQPRSSFHLGPRQLAYAVAIACVLAAAIAGFVARESAPWSASGRQVEIFRSESQERALRLADGSDVILAPESVLAVDIDGRTRALELLRGQGRFSVFHEDRPFVVTVRGARVIARGTQFLVRLASGGTLVSLIEGRVEVIYPSATDHTGRVTRFLAPGEALIVPATMPARSEASPSAESHGRAAMIDFDDVDLADAVALVNRTASEKIRLADPALARLRITGAFRAGDAEGFARSVAAAFGLNATRSADGTLWLRQA